jgi:MerR family transcriptional regulator, light-induced transcriptional regulator
MAHQLRLGSFSDRPVFNTRAVARETGVPADTFRAWERRYGVPHPKRTAGLHRLYSDRDIAIIRWLRDRTAEGVNISQAVQMLATAIESEPEMAAGAARPLDHLREEMVLALTNFDALGSERLLGEAFALYPFEAVLLDFLQPVMVEIGERWRQNQINVVAEHFASQFVRRKLAGLLSVFEGSARGATIIVGCAPEELHDLGTLLAALFLTRRGWRVIYLGAQVPHADLIATAQTLKPALVCLSAATVETALGLSEVARQFQRMLPDVLFGYGGRAFTINPELRESIPGTFLGQDARELTDGVASLLRHSSASSFKDVSGI